MRVSLCVLAAMCAAAAVAADPQCPGDDRSPCGGGGNCADSGFNNGGDRFGNGSDRFGNGSNRFGNCNGRYGNGNGRYGNGGASCGLSDQQRTALKVLKTCFKKSIAGADSPFGGKEGGSGGCGHTRPQGPYGGSAYGAPAVPPLAFTPHAAGAYVPGPAAHLQPMAHAQPYVGLAPSVGFAPVAGVAPQYVAVGAPHHAQQQLVTLSGAQPQAVQMPSLQPQGVPMSSLQPQAVQMSPGGQLQAAQMSPGGQLQAAQMSSLQPQAMQMSSGSQLQAAQMSPVQPQVMQAPNVQPQVLQAPAQPQAVQAPAVQPQMVSAPVAQPQMVSAPVTQPQMASGPATQSHMASGPATQSQMVSGAQPVSAPAVQAQPVSAPAVQAQPVNPPAVPPQVASAPLQSQPAGPPAAQPPAAVPAATAAPSAAPAPAASPAAEPPAPAAAPVAAAPVAPAAPAAPAPAVPATPVTPAPVSAPPTQPQTPPAQQSASLKASAPAAETSAALRATPGPDAPAPGTLVEVQPVASPVASPAASPAASTTAPAAPTIPAPASSPLPAQTQPVAAGPEGARRRAEDAATIEQAMTALVDESVAMAPLTTPEVAAFLDALHNPGAVKPLAALSAAEAAQIIAVNQRAVSDKVRATPRLCWAADAAECAPAFVGALRRFVALAAASPAEAARAQAVRLGLPSASATPEAGIKAALGWLLSAAASQTNLSPANPADTTHPSAEATLEALELLLASGFVAAEGPASLAARSIDVGGLLSPEPPASPFADAAKSTEYTSALAAQGPASQAELLVSTAMRMGLYRASYALLDRMAGMPAASRQTLARLAPATATTPSVLAAALHAASRRYAAFGLASPAEAAAVLQPEADAQRVALHAALLALPEKRPPGAISRADVCASAESGPRITVLPAGADLSPEDALLFARAAAAIIADVPLAQSADFVAEGAGRDATRPRDIANALLRRYCAASPAVSFM